MGALSGSREPNPQAVSAQETRAMLERAVALVKTAVAETPYWGDAEEFVKDADEHLTRTGPDEEPS